jgi:hypothetical protein
VAHGCLLFSFGFGLVILVINIVKFIDFVVSALQWFVLPLDFFIFRKVRNHMHIEVFHTLWSKLLSNILQLIIQNYMTPLKVLEHSRP